MFENMTLSRKILWGFGAMIALLMIVGLVAFIALGSSSSAFTKFNRKTANNITVGHIQENILSARIVVRNFLVKHDSSTMKEFDELAVGIDEALAESRQNIKVPERVAVLKSIESDFSDFKAGWVRMVTLMEQRYEISDKILDVKGPQMERTLTGIMEGAEKDGNAKAAYLSGSAMRHLLLARLYVVKYLEDNGSDRVTRVENELAEVSKELEYLKDVLTDRARKRELDQVTVLISDYTRGFNDLVKTISDRNKIIENTLDRLGPVIADNAIALKGQYVAELAALGSDKIKSNSFMILLMIISVILALVAGIFLSRNITRSIVTPVNAMVKLASEIAEKELRALTRVISDVSKGDMSSEFSLNVEKVDVRVDDEIGELGKALNIMMDRFQDVVSSLAVMKNNIGDLIDDSKMLAAAAQAGKLDTRADISRHQGEYRAIVQGVNATLDAVINPLNVAAEYVDSIAKGKIPEKITDTYNGDFNVLKNNLNTAIDAINRLIRDTDVLVKAALAGELKTRAEAGRHNGDYRLIVQGVNDTLDAVIGPVNEVIGVMQKMADKDLTVRVKGDYRGDLADFKDFVNTAIENLEGALLQVSEGVVQVSGAAEQISKGSQSLAQGTNEQASSLEEVSSSLEEMSSMTTQNADNARQANNLSKEANDLAENGSQAMQKMTGAIEKIKNSSDETAKIIKTIDEIAFQTNLLALNAAVEAARAGDAGKGFAVVAEEVRSLAMRSAEAAKNTAEMIEESVTASKNGVTITQEVAVTLENIRVASGKVNSLVTEIAAASKEQAGGIEQVNTAVVQMNSVTQQNAANSEQSASASEELSSQARELSSMVGAFNISSGGYAPRRPGSLPGKVDRPSGKAASHPVSKTKVESVIPLDDDNYGDF